MYWNLPAAWKVRCRYYRVRNKILKQSLRYNHLLRAEAAEQRVIELERERDDLLDGYREIKLRWHNGEMEERKRAEVARTASAAWKASAKDNRRYYLIEYERRIAAELDRDRWQLGYQQADKERMEERDKWISAEKRVAELEEAAIPVLEELIRISEGYFDTERYQIRIHAIAKLRRTLFDKQSK